jgi:hypothetical protein
MANYCDICYTLHITLAVHFSTFSSDISKTECWKYRRGCCDRIVFSLLHLSRRHVVVKQFCAHRTLQTVSSRFHYESGCSSSLGIGVNFRTNLKSCCSFGTLWGYLPRLDCILRCSHGCCVYEKCRQQYWRSILRPVLLPLSFEIHGRYQIEVLAVVRVRPKFGRDDIRPLQQT